MTGGHLTKELLISLVPCCSRERATPNNMSMARRGPFKFWQIWLIPPAANSRKAYQWISRNSSTFDVGKRNNERANQKSDWAVFGALPRSLESCWRQIEISSQLRELIKLVRVFLSRQMESEFSKSDFGVWEGWCWCIILQSFIGNESVGVILSDPFWP